MRHILSFGTTLIAGILISSSTVGCGSDSGEAESQGAAVQSQPEENESREDAAPSIDTAVATERDTINAETVDPGPMPTTPDVGVMQTVSGAALPNGQSGIALGSRYEAPDFTWENSNGQIVSLSDYRGRVVLLNFWATWCPPCKKELPDIVELRKELWDRGFEVIGVSVGERPPAGMTETDVLNKFAARYELTYPIVLSQGDLIQRYGDLSGVPTTFVIDRDGNVSSVMVGMRSKSDFRSEIEPVL